MKLLVIIALALFLVSCSTESSFEDCMLACRDINIGNETLVESHDYKLVSSNMLTNAGEKYCFEQCK